MDALSDVGIDAECYHTGKPAITRRRILESWLEGELEVVVATVAFGMGINKAEVRYNRLGYNSIVVSF